MNLITAEEINEAMLQEVYAGNSYNLRKILESEYINNWLDSEYSMSAKPTVNPVLLSASLFDGLSCLKEFVYHYSDVLKWTFKEENEKQSQRLNLLSLSILNKNMAVIDFIAEQEAFTEILNMSDSFNVSPLAILSNDGDVEFFKEIVNLAEEKKRNKPIDIYENNKILYILGYNAIQRIDKKENFLEMIDFAIKKGYAFGIENGFHGNYHKDKFQNFLSNMVSLINDNRKKGDSFEIFNEKMETLLSIHTRYNAIYNINSSFSHKLGQNIHCAFASSSQNFIERKDYLEGFKSRMDEYLTEKQTDKLKRISSKVIALWEKLDSEEKKDLMISGFSKDFLSDVFKSIQKNKFNDLNVLLEKYELVKKTNESKNHDIVYSKSVRI